MDETLLHAQQVLDGCSPRPNSCVLQFEFKGELLEFDYVPRPGIYAFLDQLLNKGYELAIFTAGVQPYADAALDSFDPTGRYFGRDRFYRQHMVEEKKDLRALFGDRLAGGAVLIDDNAHEVLPNDQLHYAVLVDHWRGDQATTAQALASLESAAKALTDKLGGGHLGRVHADVDVADDDYDQLARAAAAAAMADAEREDREAKAAMVETRHRRAASMHAWLAAVATKRCQWEAVKQKQLHAQAIVPVGVDQQEEGHSVKVEEEEEEEEVSDQTRRIFNFFIGLLLIMDMLGTWLTWIDPAQEGCVKHAKPGQVQLIAEDLEQAHVEHAAEDLEQAHVKHAMEDLEQAHVEHAAEDLEQAHVEHAAEDLGQAHVEHAAEDLGQAHVEHATEDLGQAHVEHAAEDLGQAHVEHAAEDLGQAHVEHAAEDLGQAHVEHAAEDIDLKVKPCLRRRRPSRVQRPARTTFKGRVFSSASSMWRTIGLP